ncbi:cytochrome P450 [Calocera viscosa TUFC12733]|uniref:Cytochrome P450 n=1 Tax=Calocera viscosa (strain TUFC12733) TaxID=1330018 RepID=A0A167KJ23_CALVF|nr:cytochrome P450 [Calocera viscosa TUFC12733]
MILLPVLAGTVLVGIWLYTRKSKASQLPPGPPGVPVLGNVLDLPSKLMFLKFDEWKDQYGEIMCLNLAGIKLVILNSANVAADILEKQSAVTSGRPRMVMAAEIMCGSLIPAFMTYGLPWRRFRKASHEVFNIRASQAFWPMQEHESELLVRGLYEDQTHLERHLSRLSTSVTWRFLYGGPAIRDPDEERVKVMNNFVLNVAGAAQPGASIVDIFTFLKPIPTWAAGWKKRGVQFFKDSDEYFMDLFHQAANHKEEISFVNSSLKVASEFGIPDQEVAWAAGGHFAAGVETTATVLMHFIKAMILYPEECKKGQAQVDAVCGDRLPKFSDRDELPYISAMVKEILRWRPPVPCGVPHAATEDFTYGSYIIPKGAIIMDNIWAISRDPKVFPDYDSYNPDRYLTPTGEVRVSSDPVDEVYVYSHGRRICPGRDIANHSLFIDVAALLWAFDFEKGKGPDGKEITPGTMDFVDNGLAVQPAPYAYHLKPRRGNLDEVLAHF